MKYFAILFMLVGNALSYNTELTTQTKFADMVLIENRVLDLVDTQRVKNDVGGINRDNAMMSLAEIRSKQLSKTAHEDLEVLEDIDVTEFAKTVDLECIIDDNSAPISKYTLTVPHTKFRDLEQFVDYHMQFLISHDEEKESIFAPEVQKTGISAVANNEYLLIIQNFC